MMTSAPAKANTAPARSVRVGVCPSITQSPRPVKPRCRFRCTPPTVRGPAARARTSQASPDPHRSHRRTRRPSRYRLGASSPPLPRPDCGASGGRPLTLRGPTSSMSRPNTVSFDATALLLDRGAEVNARADIDTNGVGGQTPIIHATPTLKA